MPVTGHHIGQRCFTCPCCGMLSVHAEDCTFGYCSRCGDYTGDPVLGLLHLVRPCPYRQP